MWQQYVAERSIGQETPDGESSLTEVPGPPEVAGNHVLPIGNPERVTVPLLPFFLLLSYYHRFRKRLDSQTISYKIIITNLILINYFLCYNFSIIKII